MRLCAALIVYISIREQQCDALTHLGEALICRRSSREHSRLGGVWPARLPVEKRNCLSACLSAICCRRTVPETATLFLTFSPPFRLTQNLRNAGSSVMSGVSEGLAEPWNKCLRQRITAHFLRRTQPNIWSTALARGDWTLAAHVGRNSRQTAVSSHESRGAVRVLSAELQFGGWLNGPRAQSVSRNAARAHSRNRGRTDRSVLAYGDAADARRTGQRSLPRAP